MDRAEGWPVNPATSLEEKKKSQFSVCLMEIWRYGDIGPLGSCMGPFQFGTLVLSGPTSLTTLAHSGFLEDPPEALGGHTAGTSPPSGEASI